MVEAENKGTEINMFPHETPHEELSENMKLFVACKKEAEAMIDDMDNMTVAHEDKEKDRGLMGNSWYN